MITNSVTRNPNNLLAGLTPSFTGWNINPGTNANLVNELTTVLTTSGVQTNATDSIIKYDLGVSKRVIIGVIRGTVVTSSAMKIQLSDDDAAWEFCAISASNSTASKNINGIGKGRYIEITFLATAAGNTIADMSLRVYRI